MITNMPLVQKVVDVLEQNPNGLTLDEIAFQITFPECDEFFLRELRAFIKEGKIALCNSTLLALVVNSMWDGEILSQKVVNKQTVWVLDIPLGLF